jgi:hypothetical protein
MGFIYKSLRCDFCQKETFSVRRVALDGKYDRLTIRHPEKYACPECSEKKERERLGYDALEQPRLHKF